VLQWFYYENHEPSLPSFVGQIFEFYGTWSEEPTPLEVPQVAALINKVNLLKEKGLLGVCAAAHWLARRVQPLKNKFIQAESIVDSKTQLRKPKKNDSRAPGETSRKNISRHFHMATQQADALLPHWDRKGPGKAPVTSR
jgi:hypothetical protein